jgi:hypothetical protein
MPDPRRGREDEWCGPGRPPPDSRSGRSTTLRTPRARSRTSDGPDHAKVAFLDQVEQETARISVVARDRHNEPEVRLDQLILGVLAPLVLEATKLALLGRGQKRTVVYLGHVELESIVQIKPEGSSSSVAAAASSPALTTASLALPPFDLGLTSSSLGSPLACPTSSRVLGSALCATVWLSAP